jgi:hypothetical protein
MSRAFVHRFTSVANFGRLMIAGLTGRRASFKRRWLRDAVV